MPALTNTGSPANCLSKHSLAVYEKNRGLHAEKRPDMKYVLLMVGWMRREEAEVFSGAQCCRRALNDDLFLSGCWWMAAQPSPIMKTYQINGDFLNYVRIVFENSFGRFGSLKNQAGLRWCLFGHVRTADTFCNGVDYVANFRSTSFWAPSKSNTLFILVRRSCLASPLLAY